jgi:hypothetical protein
MFQSETLKRFSPWLAAIVCLGLAIGLVFVAFRYNATAQDFWVYWRTANDPAGAYVERDGLPFAYLPTMLLWITPLSLFPLGLSSLVWIGLSAAAIAAASRQHLSWVGTGLVLLSPPIVAGLVTGQVATALAALLLWSCATNNRLAAGVVLGVIASVKPQLVALAPLMLIADRDWRAFAGAAASFVVLVALSLAAFGLQVWADWAGSLDNFLRVISRDNLEVAITPAAAAARLGLPAWPLMAFGGLLGAWLVVRGRSLPPIGKAAAIAAGSLLMAPYAMIYDLAAIVPFLAWLAVTGHITAVFAMTGALNPMPLAVGIAHLVRQPVKSYRKS